MESDNIILRMVVEPGLTTKGSQLTAAELDNNFVYIHRDLLSKLFSGAVDPYDPDKEYNETEVATYVDKTWLFISGTPETGVAPGSDSLVWAEIDPAQLVHRRNSDTKLAEFTPYEVSASELKMATATTHQETITLTRAQFQALPSTYADPSARVLLPAITDHAYALTAPPILSIDDGGTPFSIESGANIVVTNGSALAGTMSQFSDIFITAPDISAASGTFYHSYECLANTAVKLIRDSSVAISGGGADALIKITLTYQMVAM